MVDLTKHAEAILRAAGLEYPFFDEGDIPPIMQQAILAACAALADAVAVEMRDAAVVETTRSYDDLDAITRIKAIDPASLREGAA